MTVSTILFIKELLEHEVEIRRGSYQKVKKILAEKEDEADVGWNTPDSKVDDNIRLYRNLKETERKKLNEAKDALEDFLSKEWN